MWLSLQRDFDGAHVGATLWSSFLIHRLQLISADAYAFDFDIGKESVSDYFNDIDGSADGSTAGFDFYFFGAGVEEGDACKDVIHGGLFSDEHCVGSFSHESASLLVYF